MKRIELLASLSKGSKILCDVGCDHGYALIEAITKYGVKKGLACDINEGPLQIAKKNIEASGLENKISLILSNGFNNVNVEFDTAIIAGMGGSLICDILSNDIIKLKDKKLILQANNDRYKLRSFLYSNGFKIVDEHSIFEQGKYYEIIVAETGNEAASDFDLKYGPILRRNRNEAFIKHYTTLYNQLLEILPRISNALAKEEKSSLFRELTSLLGDGIMERHSILNTLNYYTTYFIDDMPRPTILVSPGGGYQYTSPRESAPVAKVFNTFGYHVVIVNYRETKEESYPKPQEYLAYAINEVNKDKRVTKLIGLGFSAGGHNILEVSLHPDKYNAKLDLLMLGYPVITSDPNYWHKGSFENLLHDDFNDEELKELLSLEKQINENALDLFLWGTYTDESVDVMNSILLIEAYKKNNKNVEYHMFPMGGHGLSVSNVDSAEGNSNKLIPYIARWASLANEWIKNKLSK
ncbi:MAG: hypothetical protein E7176_04960 [Erysipelotrichaceae bacterium]|nr:hypothetical protein [Erysipelotrichaceae bacterium]